MKKDFQEIIVRSKAGDTEDQHFRVTVRGKLKMER